MKYEQIILNCLLDKYERSKSFSGNNAVRQKFSVKAGDLFPKYNDDAEYELFSAVNECIDRLTSDGLVSCVKKKNGVVQTVTLQLSDLERCYQRLNRTPKKATNESIAELLRKYRRGNEITEKYCDEQLERIAANKSVAHFDGDLTAFENLLKAVCSACAVNSETFERDFSVSVLGDSKTFEKIRSKVVSVLFEYGDFPDKETVLEDLNIVRNPGHVFFKGNGKLTINGESINFGKFNGDLAISSSLLNSIEKIEISAKSVITIENLTTFNAFNDEKMFAVYLGGYHNTARRNFIMKLYGQNPDKIYYHYGDIDAGGFYILQHLRRKTGVAFIPYRMDAETLKKNIGRTKPLTENDRKRLENLKDSEFAPTIKYMLENNCKLEQEVSDITE